KDTVYTPQKDFGDLTGLNSMPQVTLDVKAEPHREAAKGAIKLRLKNPSSSVAFQIHPRVTKGKDGDDLVPIFWDDNYFSLLPGEEKSFAVSFRKTNLDGQQPFLTIDGYNIAQTAVPITH